MELKGSREHKLGQTIVTVRNVKIGAGNVVVMAGPCAVLDEQHLDATAAALKAAGVNILRGGAFKPRTSPDAFQGLGEEGLRMLKRVADKHDMVVTTELVDAAHLPLFIDILGDRLIFQIGARNSKNYELLKALALATKENHIPILLKRGEVSTLDELLYSAEYLLAHGNPNVMLCLRGVRTWSNEVNKAYPGLVKTRYTSDISDIRRLRLATHLPIIVDPSHSMGDVRLILGCAEDALKLGADGILVDTYIDEDLEKRPCDAKQGITVEELKKVIR